MALTIRQAGLVSALGVVACLGAAGDAVASGFALREESAEGLGDAYAGQTAKAYNASTAFYNPAGMTLLDRDEVAGTATWIAPQSIFHGSNSNPLGGNVSGTTGDNAIKAAAIGSVFGVITLNPDWKLGLSVSAPYGMRSEYKEDWVGRYQALASDVTDVEFSPTLAYKVDDHLSIAGGPRIDYFDAKLSQAINFKGIGTALGVQTGNFGLVGLANTWGDGEGKVTGDDTGYGYTLSGLYQFNDATRLGVNYRSRVFHELSGSVSYQTPATIGAAAPIAAAFTNQNVKAKITTPDTLAMGFYHDINAQWAVLSDVTWTHWSVFKTLNVVGDNTASVMSVNEQWKDSWFLSLGTNYKVDDKWTLHGGVAFDQTPVQDQYRTARIPDSDRYWLSSGVSYAFMPGADVHLGYTHIFAGTASINEAAPTNSVGGTLTGTYKNSVDIVSASFAVRF